MKNIFLFLFLSAFVLSCASDNTDSATSQPDEVDVEERLEELGIELREMPPPTANFVRTVRVGNLVFLSGHGPDLPDGGRVIGKVGADLTVEEGQEAARYAGISLLSSLKSEIGDLNRVKRFVRVTGMVNADPSFTEHSQVINGFSDLMVDLFGESGKHTRAAIGMGSLPFNMAVEIDMIVEIDE
ncbi:MAG: RidA family protein [Balneolaceae bacterium]